MPPRTGPRGKRRPKIGAPRHFIILGTDTIDDLVTAHRIELVDGNLVLRDHNDAISRIHAAGEWREIRPATMADMALPDPPEEPDEKREQASLVNENDPVTEVTRGFQPTNPAVTSGTTRKEEQDHRFVPSSPEEAQRILMELQRRLAPDHQDPPDAAPPTRKD